MSFGMQLFNAAGSKILDTADVGLQALDFFTVNVGPQYPAAGQKSYPSLEPGRTVKAFAYGGSHYGCKFYLTVSGYTVSWSYDYITTTPGAINVLVMVR